ncbi:L,D-transpeptidase family protein [Oceanomicrobium pacificus]|uniref:L,D-transpeptidase family protein n=1 Tax=Oceanomicrobium pacificus TaxID=2692916 RepID=A0A6B0TS82_9RHOB|nr:L,D-transpeptidase family protein [Oceanomicrobium pacificus]MXU64665.1 L,D-transpeptidase family protein [Oceanomicrobium pacificus]
MSRFRISIVLSALALVILAGCAQRVPPMSRNPADMVLIRKTERELLLVRDGVAFKKYKMHLGFTPEGHKEARGDGRTPEGSYIIDRRNPNSAYWLSLGISYPNEMDVARAASKGVNPGGDIFIHGGPNRRADRDRSDWTAGCIAVSDRQIREIWSYVPVGTPVFIQP